MNRYIEYDFPIGFISQLAEHESWRKEVYRPIYYIHKWWAKRLGSVFRGILLAANENFNANLPQEYYKTHDFSHLTIFDPFMGSGVTVGEAAKLGYKVIGRDINPVSATMVEACLAKYQVQDIIETFNHIEQKLKKPIQDFFKTQDADGRQVDVLYYFLVKILNCPNCSTQIELFKSRIFSKNAVPQKDPSARALCPQCQKINYTAFDCKLLTCSHCSHSYDPQVGNVNGAIVCCPDCSYQFKLIDFLKNTTEPLNHKLYAKLLLYPDGSKGYDTVNLYDQEIEHRAYQEYLTLKHQFPLVSIEEGHNTNQILKYNYKTWTQLFTPRQLVCISKFVNEIKLISDPDIRRLFACLLSGALEFNNVFCSFKGEGTGAVRHMFAHHILKPELMPIEANLWGTPKSSGSFTTLFESRILRAIAYKSDPFEFKVVNKSAQKIFHLNRPLNCEITKSYDAFSNNGHSVYISQGDSSETDIDMGSVDLVVTDPPFFDNVHYSELADFFYYWLNQMLDISDLKTTRQSNEVQDTNAEKFTEKLTRVFRECHRVLKNDGLMIFTYHHSRHEGWVSIHRALRQAGFIFIQAFPIKAEMSVSMSIQQAKIPINIDLILVCRKSGREKSILSYNDITQQALHKAKNRISELVENKIKISDGDIKMILMGHLLCELSCLNNLEDELKHLQEIENQIVHYIKLQKISKPKVKYEIESKPEQLMFFESFEKYITTLSS